MQGKNLDVDPHARSRATVFQPRHCLLWHSARPLLSEVPDQVSRCRCEAALDPMSRTNRLRDSLPFARLVRIARTWALTTNIGNKKDPARGHVGSLATRKRNR